MIKVLSSFTNNLKITGLFNKKSALTDELEFLPAVLEIQETPPSPIGRLITWLIVTFFIIALIWSVIGKVDIVAVAHGKIIPSSHSKIIQPVELSRVTVIHVHEGDYVNTGDVLIELDTTETDANQTSSQQQLNGLIQSQIRISNLLILIKNKSQKASLKARLREKKSALNANIAQVEQLQQTLPLVGKRLLSVETLYKKQLIAETQYLELKQEWIEKKQALKVQNHVKKQIEAEIDNLNTQYEQYQYDYQREQYQQLIETERKLKTLQQELIKTKQRNKQQVLKSPINGVVQQLEVHTIGGVVSPAQALMVIVPEEDALEVEAFLENKDIGFVTENQIAEIKIEAFPFTKYGVIGGKILSISNDAIQHEQLGLVFAMRINMKKFNINVSGKTVNLSPGMSVSVEVKTGKRRIIEYLARPVEVMTANTLKER